MFFIYIYIYGLFLAVRSNLETRRVRHAVRTNGPLVGDTGHPLKKSDVGQETPLGVVPKCFNNETFGADVDIHNNNFPSSLGEPDLSQQTMSRELLLLQK